MLTIDHKLSVKGAVLRAKVYCGNKLFILVFLSLGDLNVLSPNITTPDTIVSVT